MVAACRWDFCIEPILLFDDDDDDDRDDRDDCDALMIAMRWWLSRWLFILTN